MDRASRIRDSREKESIEGCALTSSSMLSRLYDQSCVRGRNRVGLGPVHKAVRRLTRRIDLTQT